MGHAQAASRRARVAGSFLLVCGAVGVVTGAVPVAVLALHVLGCRFGLPPDHWAAHGPGAMGMGVDWALLSSACGLFLGGLLIAAGLGWRRGRPWAPLVTLLYALGGLVVCGADLFLFAAFARPGPMRTRMMSLDAAAFVLALACLVGVAAWRRRAAEACGGTLPGRKGPPTPPSKDS